MAKLKLRGRDLIKIGFTQSRAIGIAIQQMSKQKHRLSKAAALNMLKQVLATPADYLEDEVLGPIAAELTLATEAPVLAGTPRSYPIYGAAQIDEAAIEQMNIAMRLPITQSGALMPDAHLGYGLPIGGVLATENAVIPYGVGMDIGCRMCLSVYPAAIDLLNKEQRLKTILSEHTRFGRAEFEKPKNAAVLQHPTFKDIAFVKKLKDKAYRQIGTSGSGNHFVEFGIVEILDMDNEFNLPIGQYVGLLSHSGSRGLGANIARYYTKIAMEHCALPKEAQHLAWLDLNSEAGQEYWQAMNLAGDYASACHHQIHERIAKALGEEVIARVENHHNFAWKEQQADGRELIVHRKGATPASKDVLGVIPGSMTAPGYIVRGKGNTTSLQSAAHGAGRQMSRRKAKTTLSKKEMKAYLKKKGVSLMGGGLDEAPFAYKDIQEVMRQQEDLVDIIGTFKPKIVRMDKG